MIAKLSYTVVCLVISYSCYGQLASNVLSNPEQPRPLSTFTNQTVEADDIWTQSYYNNMHSRKYFYYEGSPYESNEFTLAQVYRDGVETKSGLIRYNIFQDIMEIDQVEDELGEPESSLFKSQHFIIHLNGKRFKYFDDFVNSENSTGSYLEIIDQSKDYQLIKKHDVAYIGARKGENSYVKDSPAKFVKNFNYYIITPEAKFLLIPSKKRKAYEIVLSRKKEIKNYINKYNIDLNSEKDVLRFYNYLINHAF